MTREEMLTLREEVYKEYKIRVALGEFDVNSSAIQLCLHTLVDILNHTLEEMKQKKKPEPSYVVTMNANSTNKD